MVTPGVKLPFDENDVTDETTDDKGPDENVVNNTMNKIKSIVKIRTDAEIHEVQYQVETCRCIPGYFDFDMKGKKIKRLNGKKHTQFDELQTMTMSMSPIDQRAKIQRTLRDGAAWETPTVELLAKVTKASNTTKKLEQSDW